MWYWCYINKRKKTEEEKERERAIFPLRYMYKAHTPPTVSSINSTEYRDTKSANNVAKRINCSKSIWKVRTLIFIGFGGTLWSDCIIGKLSKMLFRMSYIVKLNFNHVKSLEFWVNFHYLSLFYFFAYKECTPKI